MVTIREGDAAADSSALLSNLAVLLGQIKTNSSRVNAIALHRAALVAITTELEEHEKLLVTEHGDQSGVLKDRLCQLRLERAVRCTNLASSIEEKTESFLLHKEAYEISEAVLQQMVQETGGVDAIAFAQHAVNTNNFGEAHYQQALLQEHPCAGGHFSLARRLFEQSCVYNTKIFGDDAAETQLPRSNLAALLMKRPAVEDCPGMHGPRWQQNSPERDAYCDMCCRPIPPDVRSLHCIDCNFDICNDCGPDGVATRLDSAIGMARTALAHRQQALGELAKETLVSQSLLS